MSTPQIPPRPVRSQQHHPPASTMMEVPKIPPRPQAHRNSDRSQSPNRDRFAPSPLNEAPSSMNYGSVSGGLYSSNGRNTSSSSLGPPQRPPSVSLPSVGQEGNEYAGFNNEESENLVSTATQGSPTQTRNVDGSLPLHAPKPSLSTSSAKARIATVTRTDSSQAAAAGFGKIDTPTHGDDKDPQIRNIKPKISFSRTESSASTERPSSAQPESGHGIPEIGQRVPMYPNAGDVQAPSPSPFSQISPSGIGFHNDGLQKSGRHHGRTRSGREVFTGPPGSYGLHGHGVPHSDKFEKAWYEKHPDAFMREEKGQYGPGISSGRGEWALSSEDLNKIVRETASRGSGFGTSPNIVGLPNEQIGYMASEEYASRMNSPRPQSATYHNKAHSNHSQSHVESPLRKASFPVDIAGKESFDKSKDQSMTSRHQSEQALESEADDDDTIHIDAPDMRKSKIGGNGYDPPTEDLGPHGGNTAAEGGWVEERGYGVPILASDEVAKEPGSEYMQPAVSPAQEQRGGTYHAGIDSDVPLSYQSGHRYGSLSGSANSSRPTSRPGSIHGSFPALSRFSTADDREDMHTPLEDVEEYEPLFPEDEKNQRKELSATDRFKNRPEVKKRFPSQDIWEDTPNSLQLQATVSTPEPSENRSPESTKAASAVFETPEKEAARKGDVEEEDKAKLMPKEERWAKSHFKPHVRDDMQRPGLKQRFPSRDIWEDTPDSAQLETTVEGPQSDELRSPQDAGLEAGAVVHTTGRPDDGRIMKNQPKEGATVGTAVMEKPSIPPRPTKIKHAGGSQDSSAQSASLSIPARPPQRLHQVPPAGIPPPPSKFSNLGTLSARKQTSSIEARSSPLLPERSKPQIPARPNKSLSQDMSEGETVTKTSSATSVDTDEDSSSILKEIRSPPPAPKPKPALPSRPVGGKIAALKAGFLSDLDKRLQLGPQAPPKPQENAAEEVIEEQKAPLADARKGRARGPARRKPAVSPAAAADSANVDIAKLEIVEPWTVWQISSNGDGVLDVRHAMNVSSVSEDVERTADVSGAFPTRPETNPGQDTLLSSEATRPAEDTIKSSLYQEESAKGGGRVDDPAMTETNTLFPNDNESSLSHEALPSITSAEKPLSDTDSTQATSQIGEGEVRTERRLVTLNPESDNPVKSMAYEDGVDKQDEDLAFQEKKSEEEKQLKSWE